ncbi:hypothetical protein A1O7_02133 [Cladophialophora yegresii CBS 114405]|uniref:Sulfite oxidase n=1 Tax=Cladophialophora yegresii CBS 114405 TaxID=1182544 RepID=W9WTP6_9EURO|nr:uncharacterized protein A1O7_02133 [Cladophialophora yegresii CBS 114405]EXJ61704.1 hypothetical protein A1O7_02133 [Cladophialophora yegresii CBS 114405]
MSSSEDGSVKKPVNREPDAGKLTESFLTPSESTSHPQAIAYERNHGSIRHLDATQHKLKIKADSSLTSSEILPNPIDVVFSMDDLKSRFKYSSITAALQCAGNRRHEMRERVAEVQGIDWGDGAVMNAEWGGVLLRDVLLSAGVTAPSPPSTHNYQQYQGMHVQFASAQETQEDTYYGASIPLSTALDPERQCLLATHVNGKPLTAKHGYPLRVIVPGIIGARSVKWLDSITISAEQSRNHYQQQDYKILSREIAQRIEAAEDEEEKGRIKEEAEPLMDNPINSVVAVPGQDGDVLHRDGQGRIYLRGYAIPKGKDGPVVKVEVSIDRGGTWHEASILDKGDENTVSSSVNNGDTTQRGQFAWVVWECCVPVDGNMPQEGTSIWSKATDKGGNTMDVEKPEGEWNLRGVAFNAVEGRRGIRIE